MGDPAMKVVWLARTALTALVLGIVLTGCNAPMGQSDQDIQNQSRAVKNYNEAKLKDSPPPPGEGPSN